MNKVFTKRPIGVKDQRNWVSQTQKDRYDRS